MIAESHRRRTTERSKCLLTETCDVFFKYWDIILIIAHSICYIVNTVETITFMTYGNELDQFDQNFDFKIRREHGKISYERRVYESVDDRSLPK